jgi:endonuclease/exonuclease/phosphatase family metal-dependent hydrolase
MQATRPLQRTHREVRALATSTNHDREAPARGDAHVRVGTFNIHHGVGASGDLDLARTAAAIAGLDADLVGLQEVDRNWAGRSGFADQAVDLANDLGMHLAFGASLSRRRRRLNGAPLGQYGNALLSRFPIRDIRTTLLPRPRGGERRALLHAEVVINGVALRCLVTHLQHLTRTERLAQADAIARTITGTVTGQDGPTVLVGDLNSAPGSAEVQALTEHLVDAWPHAGVGTGCTYSAQTPFMRIDYVLASPDIAIERVRVVPTDASDHLPVAADLRLPAPAAARRTGHHDGEDPERA